MYNKKKQKPGCYINSDNSINNIPFNSKKKCLIKNDYETAQRNRYINNTPYIDIDKHVIDLEPLDFKKTYRGEYSQIFRHIKKHHNRYLEFKNASKLLKMMRYYHFGVIYKISHIYDEKGHKLNNGGSLIFRGKKKNSGNIRIGRSTNLFGKKGRLFKYDIESNNHPLYPFERAITKYGWKAFKIEILAVCKTEREYVASEYFWTIYFNRAANSLGYDLKINAEFNLIIGNRYDQVKMFYFPSWEITNLVLKGWNKKDIRKHYSQRFCLDHTMNEEPINNAFLRIFNTPSLREAEMRLIKPVLDICLKRGYDIDKTLAYLKLSGFEWFNAGKTQNKKRLGNRFCLQIYGDLRENPHTSHQSYYDAVKLELFTKPYVEFLRQNGIQEQLPKFDKTEVFYKSHNGRIIKRKDIDSSKWSIIEHLYVKSVNLVEIAKVIKLIDWQSTIPDRETARVIIERYLYNRWDHLTIKNGGKKLSIKDIKKYLKAYNIGEINYKNYLKSKKIE